MARDEEVQSAIDNWAPRFVSNGVDPNDFQRVSTSVERWDDWCRKWSECGALHEQMGEQAEAGAHAELWFFEDGNHVCNNIPYKHRPQQADWMRQKLALS